MTKVEADVCCNRSHRTTPAPWPTSTVHRLYNQRRRHSHTHTQPAHASPHTRDREFRRTTIFHGYEQTSNSNLVPALPPCPCRACHMNESRFFSHTSRVVSRGAISLTHNHGPRMPDPDDQNSQGSFCSSSVGRALVGLPVRIFFPPFDFFFFLAAFVPGAI